MEVDWFLLKVKTLFKIEVFFKFNSPLRFNSPVLFKLLVIVASINQQRNLKIYGGSVKTTKRVEILLE